jgi:NADH-quinone oxidoreductase subunit I
METPPHDMRLGETEEDYYRLGLQTDAGKKDPAEPTGGAS